MPKNKQDDLNALTKAVLEKQPRTEMIILYARNEYVDYDERAEFGVTTTHLNDYGLFVVTHRVTDKQAGDKLGKDPEEGGYFYTRMKEEGVVLYDSGKDKPARCRKLNFEEIQKQAQEYFNEKFENANKFVLCAKVYEEQLLYKSDILPVKIL